MQRQLNLKIRIAILALWCLFCLPSTRLLAGGYIDLGDNTGATLTQPGVQVEVLRTNGAPFGLEPNNSFLLDTGATGIITASAATTDLTGLGVQTVAQYNDSGIGGAEMVGITAPYTFQYAGTDGVALSLPNTRLELSQSSFFIYSGIAGMPLMVGKAVGINLAAQVDPLINDVGVSFSNSAPAIVPHQYAVPLTMVNFPITAGQINATDPLPTSAPLSFAPIQTRNGSKSAESRFLLDTGAQQSFITPEVAAALGLDLNNNLGTIAVSGVGGTIDAPQVIVPDFAIHTTAGIDLGC